MVAAPTLPALPSMLKGGGYHASLSLGILCKKQLLRLSPIYNHPRFSHFVSSVAPKHNNIGLPFGQPSLVCATTALTIVQHPHTHLAIICVRVKNRLAIARRKTGKVR